MVFYIFFLLDGPNEIRSDGHLSRLGRQPLLPPNL